jgi:hypothetical protein
MQQRASRTEYVKPEIVDFGSIADNTFSRCNPAVVGPPYKGPSNVPHHIDKHLECSGY